jgi:hypothetical protein
VFLPEFGLCNRRRARREPIHLPGESVSDLAEGWGDHRQSSDAGGVTAIEAGIVVTRVRDAEGYPVAGGGLSTMTDDRGFIVPTACSGCLYCFSERCRTVRARANRRFFQRQDLIRLPAGRLPEDYGSRWERRLAASISVGAVNGPNHYR